MGLFGGSKSATHSTTNEFSLTNSDSGYIESGAVVGGDVSVGAGGGLSDVSITTTDHGALEMAANIADTSLITVDNSVAAVQTMAGDVGATLNGALKSVSSFASSATGTDQNKTVQYLIIAAAVVGAVWAFKRG